MRAGHPVEGEAREARLDADALEAAQTASDAVYNAGNGSADDSDIIPAVVRAYLDALPAVPVEREHEDRLAAIVEVTTRTFDNPQGMVEALEEVNRIARGIQSVEREHEDTPTALGEAVRKICNEWVQDNGVGLSSDWHVQRLLPLADRIDRWGRERGRDLENARSQGRVEFDHARRLKELLRAERDPTEIGSLAYQLHALAEARGREHEASDGEVGGAR